LVSVAIVAGLLGVGDADSAHALGSPTLTGITVSPAVASIAKGQTQQFTATGLFSDGTTQNLTNSVTWSSAQGLLGSLSNVLGSQGLATGLLPGVDTVTATATPGLLGGILGGLVGGPLSGTAVLTVLPAALTGITVSPAVVSIVQGQTQQFTATGLFSDGTTQNLTNSVSWSSATGLLASLSNVLGSQGLATGLLPGVDTITATDPLTLLSGVGALTVIPAGTPPPPGSPLLTLIPGSGRALTGVSAQGANFVPGSAVTVTYLSGLRAKKRASTVLCTTTVSANGSFACGGKIPRRLRSGKRGQHTVVASGPSAAQTIFTLLR
jgi:hypothetical protein